MDLWIHQKKIFKNYQSGTLSFELTYKGKKIICNSGYFQNFKHQLNNISKSSANHSTLILDNTSICKFTKDKLGNLIIEKNFKILDKKVIFEKSLWHLRGSHDGYQKKFGVIHNREIKFYPDYFKILGKDELIKKKILNRQILKLDFIYYQTLKLQKL